MSLWTRLRARRPPAPAPPALLDSATAADRAIIERASPHTMTTPAQLLALIDAVRYCEARGLTGAFAECGVWLGGSVLAMILTLQELGTERDIHLYDTFVGMSPPTEHDVSRFEAPALETWGEARRAERLPWEGLFNPEAFNLEAVCARLLDTGYPPNRLHFVPGPVEETLPAEAPAQLALLRLDTDWYASTRHELVHLFPRVSAGGVLIVDDYGHWEGARRAVDEYFATTHPPLLLGRIDYTARMAVKH